ncbi:MAG: MotA/TolQ/ExbB proton channel family protein [Thermodesulfobacteriota bacterium]|nr:MotA/TolQ/ExbB proton channel family protein [Thermodesulfobacteriota bacterium]
MDIATIIGLLGGTVLVVSAVILGGSALIFFNIPGLLIVVGGTIATSFIKFSMGDVINSIKVVMKAFLVKIEAPDEMIRKMVSYTRIAKKEGLIALEKEDPGDEFATKALRYLSDGYDEGLIADMLQKDIRLTVNRHSVGQNLFKGMGASAPAFGMIGTLIGLVQMLASMDNPASIGPAMAVALLTTLYGALIANLVCLPIADKLSMRSQEEQENKNIILEASIGIARGMAPMVLEESLKIYLSPKDRQLASERSGEEAEKSE